MIDQFKRFVPLILLGITLLTLLGLSFVYVFNPIWLAG